MVEGLVVRPAEQEADAEALVRLAHWARRWCPWTAPDGPDGLLLDTTGADHLWGGERAMLEAMERSFLSLGLSARLAAAPNIGAAWGLARFGDARARLCPAERLDAAIDPLRVEALRVKPDTVLLLRRLGLRTVGALRTIPKPALEKRFRRDGSDLPLRLSQITGETDEPLMAIPGRPRPLVRRPLAEPIFDPVPLLPELTEELGALLGKLGLGARGLRLSIFRTDGETRVVDVACARARRDAGLVRLFDGKLDDLDPGWGFDHLTLEALVSEPLGFAQARLDGSETADADLADVMDRIAARLGPAAAHRLEPVGSHVPERSVRSIPPLASGAEVATHLDRPLRLLDPPEEIRVIYEAPDGPPARFVWRKQSFRVARMAGPERVSPEWWRDRPGSRLRDYFKVEVPDGRRFWIYREGVLGDGRGGMPLWFLHGVFA